MLYDIRTVNKHFNELLLFLETLVWDCQKFKVWVTSYITSILNDINYITMKVTWMCIYAKSDLNVHFSILSVLITSLSWLLVTIMTLLTYITMSVSFIFFKWEGFSQELIGMFVNKIFETRNWNFIRRY